MKTLEVSTSVQWRNWLDRHHTSECEVWLVFYKRHTGRPSLSYESAVDQALCFGWVDSLIKRLNDQSYARKFTPRRPDSRWSDINRQRYAKLKADGRLAPAGIRRAPTERRYEARPSWPQTVPRYLQTALQKHPEAAHAFERLAPSRFPRGDAVLHEETLL